MSSEPDPTERKYSLESELHTESLGSALAAALEPGSLLILDGNLGAGKTFLAGAIVHALGLDPDEPVTSPTYNLVSEYPLQYDVAHADLYRVSSVDEVLDLGLEERRHRGFVLLVEWGKPYHDALGGDALFVSLITNPRQALVYASGEGAQRILRALPDALTPTPNAD